MKVIVLYENTVEQSAAENLALVIQGLAATLMNARVINDGKAIQVTGGKRAFPCETMCLPFDELANPKGLLRNRQASPQGVTRWQHRELIFDEDDQ